MNITEFFSTPICVENKPEFLKKLDKASDSYVLKARELKKDYIKETKDKFSSYHSTSLLKDPDFMNFRDYVGSKAWEFLDWQGFDMSLYKIYFTEMWIQEFSRKGGGNHSAHTHWSQNVSGFYFLKCSDKTSYPYFMDPRQGAVMTKLKLKSDDEIFYGSELIHYKPKPGDLIIFPGYVTHGFAVDLGLDPFRFIHFNIQAGPKEVIKDV